MGGFVIKYHPLQDNDGLIFVCAIVYSPRVIAVTGHFFEAFPSGMENIER